LCLEPAISCPTHAPRLGRELVAIKCAARPAETLMQLVGAINGALVGRVLASRRASSHGIAGSGNTARRKSCGSAGCTVREWYELVDRYALAMAIGDDVP
jgi:hypothetical protein